MMMSNTDKAFLSCSFTEEDSDLKYFFKEILEAFGFYIEIYDYQGSSELTEDVKKRIESCDCFIALVTRRHKIHGSEQYVCPPWVTSEIAWADILCKPSILLVEQGVSPESFLPNKNNS